MEQVTTVLLIFSRLTAVVMIAPILGHRSVPWLPRFVIAGCLTLVAFPLVPILQAENVSADIGSALVSEMLIGLSLGLGVTILFSAATMVGNLIGQMAGIQLPTELMIDPGNPSTAVGSFFGVVSLAVFALINGPELVLTGVLDTYSAIPCGSSIAPISLMPLLVELLQQSFVLLLRAVAPAIVSLLIATIVIGMISRSYPQLNMFQFGLNSNLIIMLLAIFFTLGGSMWLFVDDVRIAIEVIGETLSRLVTK